MNFDNYFSVNNNNNKRLKNQLPCDSTRDQQWL